MALGDFHLRTMGPVTAPKGQNIKDDGPVCSSITSVPWDISNVQLLSHGKSIGVQLLSRGTSIGVQPLPHGLLCTSHGPCRPGITTVTRGHGTVIGV
jgi:hypothetical protein